MPDTNNTSEIESAYRDLVLIELKKICESQKETKKSVDEMLGRVKTLEIVVVGIDGTPCISSRVCSLETHIEDLKVFKVKVITTVAILQTLGALIVAVLLQYLN